ncbi:peptidoglycan-binding domain-containing protein [Streptomyces sp. enrichment culture]|uniref:peptidoglycan-binding domain-containing protein n=1 Tax=Streptomyces sp. enrichment culture TaxID=1795815 RepID=UPI003F56FC5B
MTEIQLLLRRCGYGMAVNGAPGSRLTQTIRLFQRGSGLPTSGVVSPRHGPRYGSAAARHLRPERDHGAGPSTAVTDQRAPSSTRATRAGRRDPQRRPPERRPLLPRPR